MAFLALSVDELALLRFTCDLSFSEESPVYFVEREQLIPDDMDAAYHNLIAKKVLDPETFRLTNNALNRIAPVVECDARVVHLFANADGEVEQKNFYLLDDIAVGLVNSEGVFALGDDLDIDELCEHFARRLLPRRAFGERLEFRLTELEFIAFSRLVQNVRPDAEQLRIAKDAVFAVLGEPPASVVKGGFAKSKMPELSANLSGKLHRPITRPAQRISPRSNAPWEKAIKGLVEKKVFLDVDEGLLLRPALLDFVIRLKGAERHTFARYDFDDDEWLMRETSFVPVEGGLFFIGADPDDPGVEPTVLLFDVDADRLKWALESSLGSLAKYDSEETLPFVAAAEKSERPAPRP
ncbi:MAG: hypothetical protein GY822_03855 [Deltaproteobacteria bacterium]|nr:hypothetical protein [Deltaproteobacteria bacterium]